MKKKKAVLLSGAMLLCAATFAAEWQVAVRNGVPQILKDGRVHTGRMYWGNLYYAAHRMGKGSPMPEVVKMAVNSGVELISLEVQPIWDDPKRQELVLEQLCCTILAVDPRIQLVPRVKLYAPLSWCKAHPSEMMKLDNGDMPLHGSWASVASDLYRKDACDALRRTIRYLEERFPGRIAGYHPAGGNSCEWFYKGSQEKLLNGYDPATLRAFRQWLAKRYQSDAALQKAWKMPQVTLATAAVPTPEARRATAKTSLRQPSDGRQVIDFVEFQNDVMADFVIDVGKVIREECGKKRLSLLFFGYLFELANQYNGPGNSGHTMLRKVLDSKNFDIITAPIAYGDRRLSSYGGVMTPAESIMLSGVLWLDEDDTSTHIAAAMGNRAPGWELGARNLDESLKLLKRNLVMTYTHNYGIWWMDLNDHGWFKDDALWSMMRSLKPVEDQLLNHPTPYAPDLAVVVDAASFPYFVSAGGTSTTIRSSVSWSRYVVSNAAIPHGLYLQDDLLAGRIDPKLTIYTSTLALNGKDRAALAKKARQSAALWLWAPGIIDLDTGKFSLAAVQELTGFAVTVQDIPKFEVKSTPEGLKLGLPAKFGYNTWDGAVYPVLSPQAEKGDVILARYQVNNAPAVVLRQGKQSAIFCGAPAFPQELVRILAKAAKIHLYSAKPLHVYKNGKVLAFHFPKAGSYEIDLGTGVRYCEAGTTQVLSGKVTRRVTEGEVWVLTELGKGF